MHLVSYYSEIYSLFASKAKNQTIVYTTLNFNLMKLIHMSFFYTEPLNIKTRIVFYAFLRTFVFRELFTLLILKCPTDPTASSCPTFLY